MRQENQNRDKGDSGVGQTEQVSSAPSGSPACEATVEGGSPAVPRVLTGPGGGGRPGIRASLEPRVGLSARPHLRRGARAPETEGAAGSSGVPADHGGDALTSPPGSPWGGTELAAKHPAQPVLPCPLPSVGPSESSGTLLLWQTLPEGLPGKQGHAGRNAALPDGQGQQGTLAVPAPQHCRGHQTPIGGPRVAL